MPRARVLEAILLRHAFGHPPVSEFGGLGSRLFHSGVWYPVARTQSTRRRPSAWPQQ